MDRRHLLTAIGACGLSLALTGPVLADSGPGGDASPAVVNLAGVGLPVIAGGRVRNYVFVGLRLHLSPSADMNAVRAREPHFLDALVRAAHRTPFTVEGDWSRLDAATLSRSLMAAAGRIAGAGKVTRVEVVSQTPRRRTGIPTG